MPALKLAHITTVAISLEILLLDQMRYMQSAGFAVVGVSSEGEQTAALRAAGIPHFSVPMTRRITPFRDLLSIWRLFWLFRRERFDIVHTHNPKPALVARIAARLAGTPLIVHTIHGFHFHENTPTILRALLKFLERFGGLFGDLVLSQNREDLELAVRERIYPVEKLRYLGNGIDLTRFNLERDLSSEVLPLRGEFGLSEGQPVIGFVGRLAGGRKGLDYLFQALALLRQEIPNLKLLLVGAPDDGKDDSIGEAQIRAMGLGDSCIFAGWRSQDAMPALYKLMNLLVLPSSFEGLPRAVMEASAMGVPVVATDVKGNREAVQDRRTGLLVPFADSTQLAGAIKELLLDSELARTLGNNGRLFAVENFDQQRVFSTLLQEYQRLTGAQ